MNTLRLLAALDRSIRRGKIIIGTGLIPLFLICASPAHADDVAGLTLTSYSIDTPPAEPTTEGLTPDSTVLTVPTVDANDYSGQGLGSLGTDHVLLNYTGNITPYKNGNIDFRTTSDDGIHVTINGVTIIDNWNLHAPTWDYGSYNFKNDSTAPINVMFYEWEGGAYVTLEWNVHGDYELVPSTAFTTTAPTQNQSDSETSGGSSDSSSDESSSGSTTDQQSSSSDSQQTDQTTPPTDNQSSDASDTSNSNNSDNSNSGSQTQEPTTPQVPDTPPVTPTPSPTPSPKPIERPTRDVPVSPTPESVPPLPTEAPSTPQTPSQPSPSSSDTSSTPSTPTSVSPDTSQTSPSPTTSSDPTPSTPSAEQLVPHVQEDQSGVLNGGMQIFGTKTQPQVVGEDGKLTPPPPPPGSGLPIPPDAITTKETFIGQPGGTTFNSPDIAVPVVETPVTGAIAAVPGVQALNHAYVALANIGNDMSPITRKKAKKVLVTTVVLGQIVSLRRRLLG